MRTFTIDEPVFKTNPLFIVDCTYAEMTAYVKKRFRATVQPAPDGVIGTVLTFDVRPWRIVWIERATRRDIPILLHEVFHLVTRICADKGVPIVAHHPTGENGDETAAYLLEFFMARLMRRMRA